MNGHLDIVCIGEAMGQIVPEDGPVDTATRFALHVAGSESNVAAALARLGASVGWAGRLGADGVGRRVERWLDLAGIDRRLVEVDSERATGLFVKDPSGLGRTVTYYRRDSAGSAISTAFVDAAVREARRAVFISGITAALSPEANYATERAMTAARASGLLVAFDVNHRPTLWPDRRSAADRLAKLVSLADITFVGADEATFLWLDDDPTVLARRLGARELVLKDAPAVVTVVRGTGRWCFKPPPVDVVESVGAGDSFAAGYLFGRLQGWAPERSLRVGHVLAAAALRSTSDHGDVDRAGLDLALQQVEGETLHDSR